MSSEWDKLEEYALLLEKENRQLKKKLAEIQAIIDDLVVALAHSENYVYIETKKVLDS